MIVGAEESRSSQSVEAKADDDKFLSDLCAFIGVEKSNVKSSFRLGRKRSPDARPRPLKLVFDSDLERNKFLRAATTSLHGTRPAGFFRRVFVKPDLTPMEQEREKTLRAELQRRKNNGERVVIRRGHIVKDLSDHRDDGAGK